MALKLYDDTNFSNIANAIRSKNSLATLYKPREMAAAITSLVTASDVLPTKNLVGASPLRFTDGGTGGKYTSAKVLIRPIQSGTGDPSPSNKRPVIEAERIKAYYRGADNQSYTSSWIVEDLPVYGYRDLITGITENLCDYYEDNIRLSNWSPSIVLYSDSGKNIFYLNENTSYNIIAAESLLLVDPVEDINDALANMPNNSIASPKGVSIGQVGLFIRADSYSSVADLLTAIGTDKIYFLKSSPVITTSTDVLTILTEYGVNSIKAELYNWNESPNALAEPDLDITYQADPTLYTQGVVMDMLPQDQVSGSVANFPDGSDGYPIVEGIFGIVPNQEGTGDPSPSNVRPISGFTGMNVIRCGKNLFNKDSSNIQNNKYIYPNGSISDLSGWMISAPIPLRQGISYYSNSLMAGGSQAGCNIYNRNGVLKRTLTIDPNTALSFTAQTDEDYILLSVRKGNDEYLTAQFEEGSTATSYEPYQGVTISVTWADSAGNVYGGYYNSKTGTLLKTWSGIYFDGSSTVFSVNLHGGSGLYYTAVVNPLPQKGVNSTSTFPHIISDKFLGATGVALGHTYITGSGLILIAVLPDQTITTPAAATQWFADNPTYFIYELADPIAYQLTPQELTTLLGTNNIYCDTGDSDIKYRADIDLYIQKKIAEG